MENVKFTKWYAVQETPEDACDYGSFDKEEAIDMLQEQGKGLIAVIAGCWDVNGKSLDDTYCVDEWCFDDLFEDVIYG